MSVTWRRRLGAGVVLVALVGTGLVLALPAQASALPSVVWGWGTNQHRELRDTPCFDEAGVDSSDCHNPLQVPDLSGVVAVGGGGEFTAALKADGTVWARGDSFYGQGGVGGGNYDVYPTHKVTGLPPINTLAVGGAHNLALDADGRVWAWGANVRGQLGIGDPDEAPHPDPVQVPGLVGRFTAIAAGQNHSLAVGASGVVWAWGHNARGQLGVGDTIGRPSPVQVPGLSGVVAVAAGVAFGGVVSAAGRGRQPQPGHQGRRHGSGHRVGLGPQRPGTAG